MTLNSKTLLPHPYFLSTLRPSRRRYIFYRLLVTLAVYQLCFVLINRFFGPQATGLSSPATWLFYTAIYVGVYLLMLVLTTRHFVDDVSIRIVNGCIEGPTGNRRERTRFSLEQLDREKTRRVSLAGRILQYRHIWSSEGERILLLAHSFNPAHLQALYAKLDLE
jgi:hypothetical protein